jgi:hypothetical protein
LNIGEALYSAAASSTFTWLVESYSVLNMYFTDGAAEPPTYRRTLLSGKVSVDDPPLGSVWTKLV